MFGEYLPPHCLLVRLGQLAGLLVLRRMAQVAPYTTVVTLYMIHFPIASPVTHWLQLLSEPSCSHYPLCWWCNTLHMWCQQAERSSAVEPHVESKSGSRFVRARCAARAPRFSPLWGHCRDTDTRCPRCRQCHDTETTVFRAGVKCKILHSELLPCNKLHNLTSR